MTVHRPWEIKQKPGEEGRMSQELTKFEQEATKAPIWLPIGGVILFFIVMILAVVCPGEAPTVPDGGQAQEQSE